MRYNRFSSRLQSTGSELSLTNSTLGSRRSPQNTGRIKLRRGENSQQAKRQDATEKEGLDMYRRSIVKAISAALSLRTDAYILRMVSDPELLPN